MAVQHEVKSQLAKLLATEDIVVEHKHVETAQFNVQTRVLILPLWEKASNAVYDMLVGHEVGHALFTPNEDPPEGIPHNFLNVCEDARIEKLMKRKYMGLAKSFYNGYNELHDQDFFDLEDEDIDNFNLADRANLYFKIGSFLDLSFSTPEKEIITLIQNAETFTDTIAAAKALYNYCKQEQEKQKEFLEQAEQAKLDFEHDSQGSGNSDTSGDSDNESSVSDSDSSASMEDRGDSTPSNDRVVDSGSTIDDLDVQTLDSLDSKLKDLVNTGGQENQYTEIPKVNLDSVIASNEDVHTDIQQYWDISEVDYAKSKQQCIENNGRLTDYYPESLFDQSDSAFRKFKKEAQKEVSYLVKEFECKKAASAYARATTSRTGVLDTAHLHTYKYNEDLFKKISVIPDGKNHGLVFVLDWSGSMQYVLQDTLKQLYNLIWFCKKVQIPFDVYAFTQEWNRREYDYAAGEYAKAKHQSHYEPKQDQLAIDDDFNLMNLFTSKVNGKTLEEQMINIWRISDSFNRYGNCHYRYPPRLSLSGTPLNESIVCLHEILPKFQKENNVEKTQCIILTDGEAHQLSIHNEVKRNWEDELYMGTQRCNGERCFLRDRKLGKTYKFGWGYHEFTDTLIKNLKDRFPTTNFIGIRVLESRDAKSFVRLYYHNAHYGYDKSKEYDTIMSDWKKSKSFNIKNSGYDAYFGMSSSALSQDSEFDVDDSATKAQIKRAFVKSLKTKKLNKKVLGEFISLVA